LTVATTQIAYETVTGRILAIHHFQGEPEDPQSLKQAAAYLTDVPENGITVMSVQPDEIDSERNYKVDHERKALIDVPDGEGGVRFSFEEVLPPS
jgi:hypothetical protein